MQQKHKTGLTDVRYTRIIATKAQYNAGRSKAMTETEKKILETFERIIPTLSELEREKLLSFGEGMAFMKQKKEEKESVIV